VAVTLGGRERCNPDYEIRRRAYSYHGLEYVAEGVGEVELDGVKHEVRPGSVFAYAPSTACEMRTDPARPMLKYFVCFAGAGAARRLRRAGVGPGTVRTLAAHAEVRDVMDDLVREGPRASPLARTICAQLFELLLLKIEDAAAIVAIQGDPAQETFQRCKALIDAEAERLHTLREIALAAGLEESSVCRLFRRFQETSPYQYLLRRKMNLAATFLVQGGLVKEAAQRVGFADPYHFSRCFKAVHGVAPRELLRHSRKA
jgi:AraC-like DNA-binding protein